MRIGLFASGKLGLTSTLFLWKKGIRPFFLFTDKSSTQLISFAVENTIPLFIGNPRNGKGIKMAATLNETPDLMLSINYLFLMDKDLLDHSRFGCVNFHGSLLPRYRGRTPHVWAIINNERETGITAHYVNEDCDSGPIILQKTFPINAEYTGADVLAIFEENYPFIIQETLDLFQNGKAEGKCQDESIATYFGKRSPEDGLISWSWQKERINNWIRAQAYPYPGAFTFYLGEKIIIDKIQFSQEGFRWDWPNGLIISGGNEPQIKTPNGVVKIIKQRTSSVFEKGNLLV